ncbi:MAG: phosphoglycerate dehydrogenase [Chitinophagales bacterium]
MFEPTSFPKENIKVLLLENISSKAKETFEKAGYSNVEILKTALNEEELIEKLKDVRILGIRSKTTLTKKVFENAPKLMAVGCFCIGTNQVDLEAAALKGIAVFNSPFSNTRSVAELIIASCIMLIRKIPYKSSEAHKGNWLKDNIDAYEIRGKKIGIIGYGHIGSQVSIMAEALGMQVYYYDVDLKLPLGNAHALESIEEIITKCDFITLHVPATPETNNLFSKEMLSKFKKGKYLLNLSRGNVVDIDALAEAIKNEKISGAAIDVFPVEPKNKTEKFISPLQNLKNVILTPHIGGSTEEAQWNIGIDVASKLIKFTATGATIGSHAIPELSLPISKNTHRILHIHNNVPGVISTINKHISDLDINILGQFLKTDQTIGYVVLDIPKESSQEVFETLDKIPNTIKTRLLF